jgi:hypothetical protein
MKMIETMVVVDADHKATIQLPADVTPGPYQVVVVIDERTTPAPAARSMKDFPSHDVGPWPEGFTVRREEIYGDDGR